MNKEKLIYEFFSEIELLNINKIKHHFGFFNRQALQKAEKPASPKISVEFIISGFDKSEDAVEFVVSHYLKAISSDEKTIYFEIKVDYAVIFRCLTDFTRSFESVSIEEHLKEVKGTLRYLTLPYFRKIVQDDTIEAGLPSLVLPLMKVKQSKGIRSQNNNRDDPC